MLITCIFPSKILYNRTMVQLGICAFRQGMIKDAHNALLDIQSSGRAKELLGQGLLMRNMQERNAEQEKIEKRRQVSPEEAIHFSEVSFVTWICC